PWRVAAYQVRRSRSHATRPQGATWTGHPARCWRGASVHGVVLISVDDRMQVIEVRGGGGRGPGAGPGRRGRHRAPVAGGGQAGRAALATAFCSRRAAGSTASTKLPVRANAAG